MTITSFDFTELGRWPTDCFSQQALIQLLELKLNELKDYVEANVNQIIVLSQATEPTQMQWENAYTIETGNLPPIPPSAVLLWYDTTNSIFGGMYGTLTGFPVPVLRYPEFPPGAIVYTNVAYDANARSSNLGMMDNAALLPSLTFTLYTECYLIVDFDIRVTTNAASAGIDFALDEVKWGTQVLLVPPSNGFMEGFANNQRVHASILIDNVPAGVHTLRPAFGVFGAPATPPAITWGGATNVTILEVRAVAK